MLEPPDITTDAIGAALRRGYALDAAAVTFLPLGCDSSAWAYRVTARDGGDFFLKLRNDGIDDVVLRIAHLLHDRGVVPAVAPISTRSGSLWTAVDDFALILYPYIEGSSGTDRGLDERHWIAYGAALRGLHDTTLPPDLAQQVKRETFVPRWADRVARLDTLTGGDAGEGDAERGLAAFWRERWSEIQALLARTEALAKRLRAAPPPLVLCHSDIHTWNTLIDVAGRLWIVDWDEAVLAAKECDLMFAVGGLSGDLVKPQQEAWFLSGYGPTDIDPLALAYYRTARAVDELCAFAESIILIPGTGEITKRDALGGIRYLFAPGNIVSLAYDVDPGD